MALASCSISTCAPSGRFGDSLHLQIEAMKSRSPDVYRFVSDPKTMTARKSGAARPGVSCRARDS